MAKSSSKTNKQQHPPTPKHHVSRYGVRACRLWRLLERLHPGEGILTLHLRQIRLEITSSDDAASGPATYPGLRRLGPPSPCGVADWDRQMGVNARRKPFIFNCEDSPCVLWAGILPSPSTSNVNVVVPLTLGNGKLTHLPIKKVLIFNQAFSSRQTYTLLMGFPPAFCGLEKRGGGGRNDSKALIFKTDTSSPLPTQFTRVRFWASSKMPSLGLCQLYG